MGQSGRHGFTARVRRHVARGHHDGVKDKKLKGGVQSAPVVRSEIDQFDYNDVVGPSAREDRSHNAGH